MKKKDEWDVTRLSEGWLIRCRHASRKRLFHPVHATCPVKIERLKKSRASLRFLPGGQKSFIQDEWWDKRRAEDDAEWRGYTFFELEPTTVPGPFPNEFTVQIDAPRPQDRAAEDDESFELVLPGERP